MPDIPPLKTDPAIPPDQIWIVPTDISNRLDLWPWLSDADRRQLAEAFEQAAKEKRVGILKNVHFEHEGA